MEGFAAAVVLIAILLGILLVVAFDLFCLVHLATRDDRVRSVAKLAWAVAIVCISPLGGVVYLLSSAAKLTPYAPSTGDGRLRRARLKAPHDRSSIAAVEHVPVAVPPARYITIYPADDAGWQSACSIGVTIAARIEHALFWHASAARHIRHIR
jgi:hypothetical protein